MEPHEIKAIVSALFGGFVSKRFRRGMSWGEWVFTAISISGMAYVFCITAVSFYHHEPVVIGVLTGLFIGMFGIPICDMILEQIPKIDIAGIINRRAGGQ